METSTMTKTTGREYFYRVPGLMVPGYMASATLEKDIERFIDWAPDNAGKLEAVSGDENLITGPHSFLPRMEKLYVMLCAIYAHWLETEAARILRMADAGEAELCKKLAAPFVANVHTLALDIQMAQNGKFEKNHKHFGQIESFRDIISGMKLVSMLLKNANFEKALNIASGLYEFRGNEYAASLIADIAAGNSGAATLADEIISVYTAKIDSILSDSADEIEKKRILLVDDMPEVLVTLSGMLQDHYQVVSFTNGAEALEFSAQKAVDAFILDIDMPGMDGFTLAKKIREYPRQKDTPVLFLTGNSTREILIKAMACAPKAFIVKPASKNVILSRLNSCLQP